MRFFILLYILKKTVIWKNWKTNPYLTWTAKLEGQKINMITNMILGIKNNVF